MHVVKHGNASSSSEANKYKRTDCSSEKVKRILPALHIISSLVSPAKTTPDMSTSQTRTDDIQMEAIKENVCFPNVGALSKVQGNNEKITVTVQNPTNGIGAPQEKKKEPMGCTNVQEENAIDLTLDDPVMESTVVPIINGNTKHMESNTEKAGGSTSPPTQMSCKRSEMVTNVSFTNRPTPVIINTTIARISTDQGTEYVQSNPKTQVLLPLKSRLWYSFAH